jgi:hypothetical protein
LNEFPRIFFAVPTITASDQTRKQDTYQVTIFFDDLLGYDNEGDEDPTLQIDKWANLQQYANYFVQRLNKIKQTILPNYLFIPEAPSITFDSFTGIQRMITVQLSFNLVVPTNCDPGIITLVQCIANIVTSSNLTASLTTVLKFAASLEGRATVTADINYVQKVASSLNASALLSGDISFVQKAQASLLTSASVTGNITIPKTFNASLLATGTTTADLTVNAPSASLLLDLYPSAAAAYSLRKLRTAYSGSAIRVRRSSDNTEQNIGFVAGQLDTVSLLAFCSGTNGFVTTWYDQSGNARNATQTIQANQPQIVSSGSVLLLNTKPTITTDGVNDFMQVPSSTSMFNFLHNGTNSAIFSVVKFGNNSNPNSAYTLIDNGGSTGSQIGVGIYYDDRSTLPANNIIRSNIMGAAPGNFTIVQNWSNDNAILPNVQNLISNLLDADNSIASQRSIVKINNNTDIALNTLLTTPSLLNATDNLKICTAYFQGSNILFMLGDLQEIIIYPSDQTTNRTNINTNINTYYAIY